MKLFDWIVGLFKPKRCGAGEQQSPAAPQHSKSACLVSSDDWENPANPASLLSPLNPANPASPLDQNNIFDS